MARGGGGGGRGREGAGPAADPRFGVDFKSSAVLGKDGRGGESGVGVEMRGVVGLMVGKGRGGGRQPILGYFLGILPNY